MCVRVSILVLLRSTGLHRYGPFTDFQKFQVLSELVQIRHGAIVSMGLCYHKATFRRYRAGVRNTKASPCDLMSSSRGTRTFWSQID
jgi:hypothetical protein